MTCVCESKNVYTMVLCCVFYKSMRSCDHAQKSRGTDTGNVDIITPGKAGEVPVRAILVGRVDDARGQAFLVNGRTV